MTVINGIANRKVTNYKGFEIEHEWDVNEDGKKVQGTDSFIVFDNDGEPISKFFATFEDAKKYIEEVA